MAGISSRKSVNKKKSLHKKILFTYDNALHDKVEKYAKDNERSVRWAIRFMIKQFFKNAEGSTIQQGGKG